MATNTEVKRKISDQSENPLGHAIREFRRSMGADQKAFARLLGVSQGIISQWESGTHRPSPLSLMAIGKLGGADKAYWFREAGPQYEAEEELVDKFRKIHRVNDDHHRTVLIYGEVGAGPFRYIPEKALDRIALPRSWFRSDANIVGLIASGDSMSPLIETGHTVLVDRSQTNWDLLVNTIVAVGDGEGLTLKWLRVIGGQRLLVPNNPNIDNPVVPVILRTHKVFGKVERWIGQLSTSKT